MSNIYKEIDVNISVDEDGEKDISVPAMAHEALPGLCVTMRPFGVFTITHVPTGRKMSAHYERAFTAFLHMTYFGLIARDHGFSWADIKTMPEGMEKLKAIGDNPIPFEGGTITRMGETKPMKIIDWVRCLRWDGEYYEEFPWETEHALDIACALIEEMEG